MEHVAVSALKDWAGVVSCEAICESSFVVTASMHGRRASRKSAGNDSCPGLSLGALRPRRVHRIADVVPYKAPLRRLVDSAVTDALS